jgi:hypothetical protein
VPCPCVGSADAAIQLGFFFHHFGFSFLNRIRFNLWRLTLKISTSKAKANILFFFLFFFFSFFLFFFKKIKKIIIIIHKTRL